MGIYAWGIALSTAVRPNFWPPLPLLTESRPACHVRLVPEQKPDRRGGVSWRLLAASAACGVLLAGCGGDPPRSSPAEAPGAGTPASFAQFTDIPIPSSAGLDNERSLVLGSQDAWLGRVVLNTSSSLPRMFEFYSDEMRRFGWSEVTTVRGDPSTLTFTRGGRVATVQIESRTIRGALVSITMSPRGQEGGTPSSGTGAPPLGSGGAPSMAAPPSGPIQTIPLR